MMNLAGRFRELRQRD